MHNIILLSQARQGHHAIMEWLCQQPSTATYFNNCLVGKRHIKFRNTRSDYEDGICINTKRYNKEPLNLTDLVCDSELTIYNFINCDVSDNKIWTLHESLGLETTTYCIVIRDLYNFMASTCTKSLKGKEEKLDLWKKMVRVCLGSYPQPSNFIDINFNNWFKFVNYRLLLLNKLNLGVRTLINTEHSYIGKSAFQKSESNPIKLNVLKRWKETDKFWNAIDDEAIELSKRYFGFYIDREQMKEIRS